ncbi:hypothetical protein PGB90_005593 [Kerria lacca]
MKGLSVVVRNIRKRKHFSAHAVCRFGVTLATYIRYGCCITSVVPWNFFHLPREGRTCTNKECINDLLVEFQRSNLNKNRVEGEKKSNVFIKKTEKKEKKGYAFGEKENEETDKKINSNSLEAKSEKKKAGERPSSSSSTFAIERGNITERESQERRQSKKSGRKRENEYCDRERVRVNERVNEYFVTPPLNGGNAATQSAMMSSRTS